MNRLCLCVHAAGRADGGEEAHRQMKELEEFGAHQLPCCVRLVPTTSPTCIAPHLTSPHSLPSTQSTARRLLARARNVPPRHRRGSARANRARGPTRPPAAPLPRDGTGIFRQARTRPHSRLALPSLRLMCDTTGEKVFSLYRSVLCCPRRLSRRSFPLSHADSTYLRATASSGG